MSERIRLCLYNPDQSFPLENPFEQVTNIQMIGHASSWSELKEELKHSHPELLAVNLDANESLEIVNRANTYAPRCGIIGVSTCNNPHMIIKAMRAGCAQFVPWPVDIVDLTDAIERIISAISSRYFTSKRICVVGSSGGAGATTIACNLAMELSHLISLRCALVDLNLELGDVGCVFDCRPRFSIADLCGRHKDMDDLILSKAFHDLPCNVSVLVRPDELEHIRQVTPEDVKALMTAANRRFPFTIVDLPRSFGPLTAAAVHEADLILIVTQLGVSFIRNATRIHNCLCQIGASEDSIQVVINRHKANHQRVDPDDVEAHFGKPPFAIIPNDYGRVQASLDRGHPIMTDNPNSPARVAIYEMAREIASGQVLDASEENASAGLLRRFWKGKTADRAVSVLTVS